MAKILDMPKLSPTMEEGQLASWHKKEGDTVDVDELLAEVETDKATMEFRSFDKGTLLKILVPPGSVVRLGQAVAILGQPGEDISALLAKVGGGDAAAAKAEPAPAPAPDKAPAQGKAEQAKAPAQGQAPAQGKPEQGKPEPAKAQQAKPEQGKPEQGKPEQDKAPAKPASPDGRVKASPYVRKLAREQGLDLHGVEGSGPAGRVVARDLAELQSRPAPAAPAQAQGGEAEAPAEAPRAPAARPAAPGRGQPEAKPLSMMRKTIARRLTESKQTVPHFYLTIDVDAEALVALRETVNRELAKGAKGEPEKVSVNDLLVKACAIALRREPACNAQFTPEAILYHSRVDISVAVSVPDGLLTPVVRDADLKSVVAIGREVRELAGRAKEKKLAPEEMADGTFSISNLGMFGIDEFAAVINPPEGAILAVGRVRDEPVVRDGAVVPGKRLAMTLSCDHRVV
ncbi:MAG TPA: dihydrolipoamide acetyltransferase family protein, partial [Polyangiaceae bacterium]|nr:dihydrolipoamide acetyltransferase family protein [Polyangiaceae bacterium]